MIVVRAPAWFTLALLTSACGPSIADLDLGSDGTTSAGAGSPTGVSSGGDTDAPPTTEQRPAEGTVEDEPVESDDGVVELLINATNSETWRHVDLATGRVVDETGPWVLRFRRHLVQTNGGANGDAGVTVSWSEARFEEVEAAPEDGWASDEEGEGEEFHALGEWYDYNINGHILTPAPGTWFVRGPTETWALVFLSYYDAAGTSAMVSIRYKPVEDPARDDEEGA